MKKHLQSVICLGATAATLAAATLTTQAQTWETVFPNDDSEDVAGVSGDIGTDAAGNVYAVGRYLAADGSSVAIVQGSADQGASWSVLDQYRRSLPWTQIIQAKVRVLGGASAFTPTARCSWWAKSMESGPCVAA